MYQHNTIRLDLNQEVQQDLDPLKINNMDYRQRKLDTQRVAAAYKLVRERQPQHMRTDKGLRMWECSNFLLISPGEDGQAKVKKTNACKIRLCPWCSYRRSVKAYHTNAAIYDYLAKNTENKDWLLLTLTVKNFDRESLQEGVGKLLKGVGELQRRKRFKEVWAGSIRQVEVTYNRERDTYHPHVHILVNVGPSYWTRGYITQEEYAGSWADVMGLDYNPVIDVRKVTEPEKAVAEISKYATKYGDILSLPMERLAEVVDTLDTALHGRRLIGYTGAARNAKRILSLPDPEQISGTEDENVLPQIAKEILYRWHWKSKKYVVDCTHKKDPKE